MQSMASPSSQIAHVLDGGGGRSSNQRLAVHASFNQPSPVGFSANGRFLNSAGFLSVDDNHPASSADSDGDGLHDWSELTGWSSDPVTPSNPYEQDSDGDGATDHDEILAGTNPADPDSRFEIVHASHDESAWHMTWLARGGKAYRVYAADSISGLNTNPVLLGEVIATGGVAPWWSTVAVFSNDLQDLKFYMIQAP